MNTTEFKDLEEQNSSYIKASARLIEIRKEYKDLLTQQQQGKLDKSLLNYFNELGKEVESLDKMLKDIDASTGMYYSNKPYRGCF